jgi:hypothetical protein
MKVPPGTRPTLAQKAPVLDPALLEEKQNVFCVSACSILRALLNFSKGSPLMKTEQTIAPCLSFRFMGRVLAVQIIQSGAVKDELSLVRAPGQWFAALPPISGFILNKNETPFAPINWDRYAQIKTS